MASTVLVTGNTYPVRVQLAKLGGEWDKLAKGWRVPADKADEARKLVAQAPQAAPRKSYGGRPSYPRTSYASSRRRRNEDDECEVCGGNKWTCGHCVGW